MSRVLVLYIGIRRGMQSRGADWRVAPEMPAQSKRRRCKKDFITRAMSYNCEGLSGEVVYGKSAAQLCSSRMQKIVMTAL